ncbi:MAG: zinc-binding dehydrogenase [SAR324 cluster bacterium]|nr:zinc-binding dehydrogenase [SAR324 cluster bacterium]
MNHRTQDFAAEVNSFTGGRGADVILDPVGGDVFDQSTKCIAWSGRLVVVGFASGRIPEIAANRMLLKNIAVTGFFLGSYRKHAPDRIRNAQQQVFDWVESKQVKPLISHVLRMDELRKALGLLESRQSSGTVIVMPK